MYELSLAVVLAVILAVLPDQKTAKQKLFTVIVSSCSRLDFDSEGADPAVRIFELG